MIDAGHYIGKAVIHNKYGNGTVLSMDTGKKMFTVKFDDGADGISKGFMLARNTLSLIKFSDEQLQSDFSELILSLTPIPANNNKPEQVTASKPVPSTLPITKETASKKVKVEKTESLEDRLKANYQTIYESVFNNKKAESVDGVVNPSDSDAWLLLLSLAKSKKPDAIFELCAFHRNAAVEVLKNLIPETILPLFGVPLKDQIKACGLYNLYQNKGKKEYKEYKQQWVSEREKAFSGTADGFYDEGTSWPYIESSILPIATKDIWDSLNDFYNGEFAMTPPEDQSAFTLRYQDYLSLEKTDSDTKNSAKKQPTFAESKQLTDRLINQLDLTELLSVYKRVKSCNQTHILYRSLAVGMTIREQADTTGILVQKSREFIQEAPSDVISKTFANLEFAEIQKITQYLSSCMKPLPDNWISVFKSKFETSLDKSAECSWWVHILYQSDVLLKNYSQNLDFWLDQNPRSIDQLISTFQSCMLPKHFLEFARTICLFMQNNLPDGQIIYTRWKKAALAYLLKQGDNEDAMRQFRNLAEIFDPQEIQSVMEDIFSLAASQISMLSSHSAHSDSDTKTKQFTSSIHEIEELEVNVMQQILLHTGETGANYDQLKHLDNLRSSLANFVEHNWGKQLEAVVSNIDFVTCKTLKYNSAEHHSNEGLQDGQLVHALSRGIQIDHTIIYKARVTAKYIQQEAAAE